MIEYHGVYRAEGRFLQKFLPGICQGSERVEGRGANRPVVTGASDRRRAVLDIREETQKRTS